MPIQRSRSCTGRDALYSSLVSSVLKKLDTDGCPALSTCSSSPSRCRLQRPQIRTSGSAPKALVGSSRTIEQTLASVLESTPVQGDSGAGWTGEVKFRLPDVSNRLLTPSKSKKNASLRAPAKNVKLPDVAMCGVGPKDTSTASKIFSPTASGSSASSSAARYTSTV